MTGNSIKTALAFALLVGVASQANANDWHHIDQMAAKIQHQTKQLKRQVVHYRYSSDYGELIRCTSRLSSLARHVRHIAKHGQSLVYLQKDVRDLKRMYRKVEDLFNHIEEDAAHGIGRIQGSTAHVRRMLDSIAECIHYLEVDLRSLTRACPSYRASRPVYYGNQGNYDYGRGRPVYRDNRSRYGGSGFGISIGGGSSRISFRF